MSTENNKLIADFMNKPYDYLICDVCEKINPELDNPESGSRITKCCPRLIGNYGKTYRPDSGMLKNFKYDTSWDWLMPVWVEMAKQGWEVHGHYWKQDIGRDAVVIKNSLDVDINVPVMFGEIKIENVYDAVVQFVKWHKEKIEEVK